AAFPSPSWPRPAPPRTPPTRPAGTTPGSWPPPRPTTRSSPWCRSCGAAAAVLLRASGGDLEQVLMTGQRQGRALGHAGEWTVGPPDGEAERVLQELLEARQ